MKGRHGRGCEDRKQLYRGQWYRGTRDTWPAHAPVVAKRMVCSSPPFPLEDSMDEQRKYAILLAATILAARKLNGSGHTPWAIGSGSNLDERLPPPRPERSQRDSEQLVQGSPSSARPLRVQSEQLPTESQVFADEVRAGAKRADNPPEEMPERHNHYRNYPNSALR